MIANTIGMVGMSLLKISNPSTAEETEIGGVMMPSASNAAPPIIAGHTRFGFLRRINANNEKIPPSPLLSARSVIITYLIVVCNVIVQNTHDRPPNIRFSEMIFEPAIAFITYKGDVPMSPYMIPNDINKPAAVSF